MSVRSLIRSGLVNFVETRSMLVGNEAFVIPGDYELIQTRILSGNESSVIFSNLGDFSSTYKHLQLRIVGRTNKDDTDDELRIVLNGDTGSNYSIHDFFAAGTGRTSSARTSQQNMYMGRLGAANINSNIFGPNVVDILDAYSTTKNKTLKAVSGTDRPTNPFINLNSGAWYNTAPITSITVTAIAPFVARSRFSLYGIRG